MKITRLELETNKLASIKQFYSRQLGMPIVSQNHWSITFRVGWSELVFWQTENVEKPYHFAINIPLYSLEQYLMWYDVPYIDAGSRTCKIAQFPKWKARASYFFDPMGNVVEFIERYDAGYADGFFQGISEIGLATDDVTTATDYLADEYGVSQFAKSQPLPDFNAVGDDYGLLILAQTNRPWLFTNVPAAPAHCRVEFSDQSGQKSAIDSRALVSLKHEYTVAA